MLAGISEALIYLVSGLFGTDAAWRGIRHDVVPNTSIWGELYSARALNYFRRRFRGRSAEGDEHAGKAIEPVVADFAVGIETGERHAREPLAQQLHLFGVRSK